jgi:hypothetical protein
MTEAGRIVFVWGGGEGGVTIQTKIYTLPAIVSESMLPNGSLFALYFLILYVVPQKATYGVVLSPRGTF